MFDQQKHNKRELLPILLVLLFTIFLAQIGCCESPKKLTEDSPQSILSVKKSLPSWIYEEPEESRWNTRMGSIQLSLSLFKTSGWEKYVEGHANILKGFGFNAIESHMHHYRFGDIDNWPVMEKNIKIVADIIHGLDMKFYVHHSAVFVYDNKLDKKIGIDDYTVGDIGQVDVRTGKPHKAGTAVVLCPNNPLHFKVYSRHLRGLVKAGVDGVMSDDLVMYQGPYSCTCQHCRKKFINQGGFKLPPADDESFWMNMKSAKFRQWLDFRIQSVAEHYKRCADLFDEYPRSIDLFYCNSDPSSAWANVRRAWNLEAIAKTGITSHYFEPFDVSASYYDYFYDWYNQAIEMKIIRATSKDRNIPIWVGWYVAGTTRYTSYFPTRQDMLEFRKGYSPTADFYLDSSDTGNPGPREKITKKIEDQTRFTYGLNRLYGDETVVCVAQHLFADVMKFDAKYQGLWKRRGSVAKVGLVFSGQTRNWYIDDLFFDAGKQRDIQLLDKKYANGWRGWATTLLDKNVPFDVLLDDDIEGEIDDQYDMLILPSMACMSKKQCNAIRKFVKNGGTIIATNETSLYDETGKQLEIAQLGDLFDKEEKKYGKGRVLYCSTEPGFQARIRRPVATELGRNKEWGNSWIGKAIWLGAEDEKQIDVVAGYIGRAFNGTKAISIEPEVKGLVFEAYKGEDSVVLHFLNTSGVKLPKNTIYVFPLTTNFPKLPVDIVTVVLNDIKVENAILLSPDIKEPISLKMSKIKDKTNIFIPSSYIERYAVVVLD